MTGAPGTREPFPAGQLLVKPAGLCRGLTRRGIAVGTLASAAYARQARAVPRVPGMAYGLLSTMP